MELSDEDHGSRWSVFSSVAAQANFSLSGIVVCEPSGVTIEASHGMLGDAVVRVTGHSMATSGHATATLNVTTRGLLLDDRLAASLPPSMQRTGTGFNRSAASTSTPNCRTRTRSGKRTPTSSAKASMSATRSFLTRSRIWSGRVENSRRDRDQPKR